MIHPRLATMLVVITTDYPLAEGEAGTFLRPAVEAQLQPHLGRRRLLDERCGRPARERRERRTAGRRRLRRGARARCAANLARQVVADGEGATVVLEIGVTGAATEGEAEAIARRIATSPLVKTAAFGHDPNWGRVLMAAGSAPYGDGYARLDTDRLSVSFDGVAVFSTARRPAPCRSSPARSAGSTSTSGSATARPATSRPTSPTTTSGSTRSTRREPDRAQARRPGRRRRGGAGARACARRATRSSSSTGQARRSRPRWSGAGSHRPSSTGGA